MTGYILNRNVCLQCSCFDPHHWSIVLLMVLIIKELLCHVLIQIINELFCVRKTHDYFRKYTQNVFLEIPGYFEDLKDFLTLVTNLQVWYSLAPVTVGCNFSDVPSRIVERIASVTHTVNPARLTAATLCYNKQRRKEASDTRTQRRDQINFPCCRLGKWMACFKNTVKLGKQFIWDKSD